MISLAKPGNPVTVLLSRTFVVGKVSNYLLYNYRVFDTGSDPDIVATFATYGGLLEGLLLAGLLGAQVAGAQMYKFTDEDRNIWDQSKN
jgi:hypothetical protein